MKVQVQTPITPCQLLFDQNPWKDKVDDDFQYPIINNSSQHSTNGTPYSERPQRLIQYCVDLDMTKLRCSLSLSRLERYLTPFFLMLCRTTLAVERVPLEVHLVSQSSVHDYGVACPFFSTNHVPGCSSSDSYIRLRFSACDDSTAAPYGLWMFSWWDPTAISSTPISVQNANRRVSYSHQTGTAHASVISHHSEPWVMHIAQASLTCCVVWADACETLGSTIPHLRQIIFVIMLPCAHFRPPSFLFFIYLDLVFA